MTTKLERMRMPFRRALRWAAVAWGTAGMLSVLYVAGCDRQAETNKVRIAYIPFNNCLPFFVALENGLFEHRGLRVEAVRCNDSTEALNALLAGQVDALAGITFSSYWAAEQEQAGRLKLFLCHYETPDDPFSYLLVPKDSGISDPNALRGKRVGTYTGVSQLLYLRLFLKKVGLEPDRDVSVVQVGSELQIQALVAGQYDALFTVEPYGTIAVLKGIARVLIASPRTKYIENPFWGGAAAVTTETLGRRRAMVSNVYQAMAEAVQLIRADPSKAKGVLTKYTPMEPEVARRSGIYKWTLLGEDNSFVGLQQLADLMTSEGVLRTKVSALSMLIKADDLK